MDTRVKNELLYILTVLNMVADGRTTDYDGAPIAVQASIAVRGLEDLLDPQEDESDEDEMREFEVTEYERILRSRTFTVTAHSDSEAIEIAEYMGPDGKGDYEDEILECYFDVEPL